MTRIAFSMPEVEKLVRLTRSAKAHITLDPAVPPAPGLILVKAEGTVYLMSSAAPRVPGPRPRVYATDAATRAREVGGEDFAEFIPLSGIDPLMDVCTAMYVDIGPDALSVFGAPKSVN